MIDVLMGIKIQIAVCVAMTMICLSVLVFTGQPLWLFLFIWNYVGSIYFLSVIDKSVE